MLGIVFAVISLVIVIPYNKMWMRRFLEQKATVIEGFLNMVVVFALAVCTGILTILTFKIGGQDETTLSLGLAGIFSAIPFLVSMVQFYFGLQQDIFTHPQDFIWDGHIDPTLSDLNGSFMAYLILGVQDLNFGIILVIVAHFKNASLLLLIELLVVLIAELIYIKRYPRKFERQLKNKTTK
ncbi:hypothetical protein [Lactobacillus sp. PV034]|uniref:hypothetical protein n=1 Tax=Lactobacillus sp. PV034 TaxID=2594495 RepID=UPI00223F4162|nr:hypothetical protein [Lactobacillus sp. PV034]QNQ80174.1 hypothetical protein FP432_00695 [Lactobacillus sp. PV034]